MRQSERACRCSSSSRKPYMRLDRALLQANLGPKNTFLMLRNHGLLTLGSRCERVACTTLAVVW